MFVRLITLIINLLRLMQRIRAEAGNGTENRKQISNKKKKKKKKKKEKKGLLSMMMMTTMTMMLI